MFNNVHKKHVKVIDMSKRKRVRVDLTMHPSTRTIILQEAERRGFTFGVTNDVIISEWLQYRKRVPELEEAMLKLGEEVKYWRAWDAVFLAQNLASDRAGRYVSGDDPLALVCPICEAKDSKTQKELALHCATSHPFQDGHTPALRHQAEVGAGPYQCPYCNAKPFDTREDLEAHINAKHSKIKEARRKLLLRTQTDVNTFQCIYCDHEPFLTEKELKAHVKEHHPAKYDAWFRSGRRVG